MKIKKLLLCALLILPLIGNGMVFADEGDHSTTSDQTTIDTTATKEKTREERVTERKTKTTERLTQVKQNQVKLRCKAANGLIKSAQSRIGSFEAKRTHVYSGLVTRLQELSPKFKAAGVDVTKYDEQVATLKTKADAYDADITALKTSVDDLAGMDCAADPEGFMATLMEAKELRTSVIAKGKDFRAYLKDTLKPTLTDIRTQIKAKNTEGEG